jgi:polar amino acid transport system permease protein
MAYKWRFDVVWDNAPLLLSGLGETVSLSFASMVAGLVLGLVVALARLSPWRLVRLVAYGYTEFFRTTPLLVQIMWVYTVLPLLTGIVLSPFYSALVALGLNVSAFMAEIYRAGIMSIGRGQREASLALGMTSTQMMSRIILPQAVTRMIPPMGTMWVSLFKDTSIASFVGVTETMYQARLLAVETYRPLEVFTAVAVIYFVITYPQSIGVNYLYKIFRTRE